MKFYLISIPRCYIFLSIVFSFLTNIHLGTSGERCVVTSNYFKLLTTTDWCLYQYHVDFAPEEDRTSVRKALMKPHKERFGAYTFDGTSLYTSRRLPVRTAIAI